jgi:Flp pilus assembly protein TadG
MNVNQRGSTTVEFAMVFLLFLMFLLGVLDFSRMLYTWQGTNAATRIGARYAVVCAAPGDNSRILARMQQVMPEITTITVAWEGTGPSPCTTSTCEGVTVAVTGMNFRWISPIPNALAKPLVLMPGFSTYLPREMMNYDPLIC